MDLGIDLAALLYLCIFAVIGWLLWRWGSTFEEPRLLYSSITDFSFKGLRSKLASLPQIFRILALAFFCLAFIDPHYYSEKKKDESSLFPEKNIPTEGIAIYFDLDLSGSMSDEVTINRHQWKKIDLLKQVTHDFIVGNQEMGLSGRPNDMIGLVTFARSAQVLSPLTLDDKAVIDQLNKLEVVTDEKQDATAIGYAVYKTVDLIAATRHYAQELSGVGKPAYEIKNSIIILVTDGLQSPSPLDKGKRLRNMDLSEAGEYAKKNNVKLYIINIEPRIARKEFDPERHLMERVTALTGGKYYNVGDSLELHEIYSDIDQIEKSEIPEEAVSKSQNPNLFERVSFYGFLVLMGILFLFISIFLDATILRRIP